MTVSSSFTQKQTTITVFSEFFHTVFDTLAGINILYCNSMVPTTQRQRDCTQFAVLVDEFTHAQSVIQEL